jgi:hypothetical protein
LGCVKPLRHNGNRSSTLRPSRRWEGRGKIETPGGMQDTRCAAMRNARRDATQKDRGWVPGTPAFPPSLGFSHSLVYFAPCSAPLALTGHECLVVCGVGVRDAGEAVGAVETNEKGRFRFPASERPGRHPHKLQLSRRANILNEALRPTTVSDRALAGVVRWPQLRDFGPC